MKKFLLASLICLIGLIGSPGPVFAGGISDLRIIISSLTNIFSYNNLVANYTYVPPVTTGEWTQFGHDGQRTSYTDQIVNTPWQYKWQWNGAGVDGKKQTGHISLPDLVQPITGGGLVYVASGTNGIYALNQTSGAVAWNKSPGGNEASTPAYDNNNLYAVSANGTLYKLDAMTGNTAGQFASGQAFSLAPLVVGNNVYFSAGNYLYAVDKNSMQQIWRYDATSRIDTPPAYSNSKLVVVSTDLFAHAVNAADGIKVWRIKPTNRTPGNPGSSSSNNLAEVVEGWPVIAQQHGVVFIRYRLDWQTLWSWNPYPTTNAQIRANLVGQPNDQALFALNLSNGSSAFVPAVGNGGAGDGGNLPMGPLPVIRNISGTEVAYVIWRNGLTCASGWCDGREDATMGEMVLDGNTVAGYAPGDVRFVQFTDIQTDEMMQLTGSNDIIFHNHWLASEAHKITDRGPLLGATFVSPIKTVPAPFTIWRQCYQTNTCNYPGCTGNTYCGASCSFDATHRYCSSGLYSYGDARSYPGGFYEYMNDMNSGTTPYTIVSNSLVIVKTNDGAIMVYQSGNPLAMANTTTTSSVLSASSTQVPDVISPNEARSYVGASVTVKGKILSTVNHLPKAIYLGFSDPHDGNLLVRIFNKDLSKFTYDPMSLKGKNVEIKGLVTLYWPEGKDAEIVVTDPSQIKIVP